MRMTCIIDRSWIAGWTLILACVCGSEVAVAGKVELKNGVVIEGAPAYIQGLSVASQRVSGEIATYPIILIDSGIKRYFVPRRQAETVDREADLARYERFELRSARSGGGKQLQQIGLYSHIGPFDERGRRTVTLQSARGPLHVIQAVTEIRPQYLQVTGVNYHWEHGIATTSVPYEQLDAMLRTATDAANPDDRLAISRFYLQAGMYTECQLELDSIVRDFPELADRVEEITVELRSLLATRLITELRHRRQASQHRLAYNAAKTFPTEKMSAAVLREVRELIGEYKTAVERATTALHRLGELQATLEDPELVAAVTPMRSVVREQLDFESLDRLEPFLTLLEDDSLTPAQKLSLAYSGWAVGGAHAVTDLKQTIRFWEARNLIREYLHTDDGNLRAVQMQRLIGIEDIGVDTVVRLIGMLPPVLESGALEPGVVGKVEVAPVETELPASYSVLLPQEYSPNHAYPLIVTLRAAGRTTEKELVWWGGTPDQPGQSQRHGYIVIAPEYAGENQREYDHSAEARQTVLECIYDARKRFHVDSDRIFLAGHGMGGDAAFDIGMTHPDLFAGVIPIAGISSGHCMYNWQNAEHVAWYVVAGELDRNTYEDNARELSNMLRHGYDLIYAVYKQRGFETYYAEIHRLFEWMDLHTRVKHLPEFEMRVTRPSERRFYWVEADELPANVTQTEVNLNGRARVRPMQLKARITPGNTIYITSGANVNTIRLSPDLIDFDKRVKIDVRRRQKFNDFLRPDLSAMLDELRLYGDRQNLVWVKMRFD